jgi:hypothetical protein
MRRLVLEVRSRCSQHLLRLLHRLLHDLLLLLYLFGHVLLEERLELLERLEDLGSEYQVATTTKKTYLVFIFAWRRGSVLE